ncbi:juvenile hormone esterase-like [Lutzomyia longipalpis]|uniref:juvenile hormone esterase-like n=1 Tax=Lutzomyia longipalpis TaxID=7200 RepID=UPI0024841E8E|nr:juvenile hormone esterase-like [Lutzomyia longipalpis]
MNLFTLILISGCLILGINSQNQSKDFSEKLTYSEPEVCAKAGCVRGKVESGRLKPYDAFYGIPYAEPPVGKLRFESPVPYAGWSGYWNATYPRDSCTQRSTNFPNSEDCLYLNIYRPIHRLKDKKLPVMVWIHGGSFISFSGSPDFFGPEYLMDNGEVIVVTLNYRLGIFGFLCSGDEAVKGNFGLKDQQLALQWVASNIESFGGDQNSITLAGHSSGAATVHLQMMNSNSQALFHRVILMSGSALGPFMYPIDFPAQFRLVAKSSGLSNWDTDSKSSLAKGLKNIEASTLLTAMDDLFVLDSIPATPLRPCVEGNWEGAFMTEDPRKGPYSFVELLTGKDLNLGVGHLDNILYLFTIKILFPPFEENTTESKMVDIYEY